MVMKRTVDVNNQVNNISETENDADSEGSVRCDECLVWWCAGMMGTLVFSKVAPKSLRVRESRPATLRTVKPLVFVLSKNVRCLVGQSVCQLSKAQRPNAYPASFVWFPTPRSRCDK